MKNWKKFAALGLAVVMTAGALAGCGGGSGSGGGTAETTAAPAADKTEADAAGGETQAEAKEDAGDAADSGELKEIYVFIRDRGDLSYWDSMAEGSDRAVVDFADRANVHVVERDLVDSRNTIFKNQTAPSFKPTMDFCLGAKNVLTAILLH